MRASITALIAAYVGVASSAAAVAAEKPGLPQLNPNDFAPQLFWLAITFGLLYLIMSRVALPRIGEVIEERRDRIQRDLDEAVRLKAETDAALKAYEQSLADARGKAQGLAKATRDKLAAETDSERHRVEGELNAKLAETEKRIAATKAQALASVDEIAASTASDIVSRLTGKSVSDDEVRQALARARRV
jgi:F-type H+-transporting ATPase subunit b